METVTDEVNSGIRVVNTAGGSFGVILETIEQSAHQIKQVTEAVKDIVHQAEQVTAHMESVTSISEQSASGMQNVAAVTEEQLASMQEISVSAASLTKMAEDMQATIGTFKL
jgi:methyl-accepting chemotaxis protein